MADDKQIIDLDALGASTITNAQFIKELKVIFENPTLTFKAPWQGQLNQIADDFLSNHKVWSDKIANTFPKVIFPSSNIYRSNVGVTLKPEPHKLKVRADIESKSTRKKKGFGLYFIQGNSVQHGNRKLRSFSLATQHGRFLDAALSADGNFVSDKRLFIMFDKTEQSELSHIRRNLVNAFKANNLEIIIERRSKPKGYVLIDILKTK